MLQKFKHLHCLKFVISSLNKQLKAPTLIYINKLHFVSYCSTVMLYAVSNFLFLVHYTKCASQWLWSVELQFQLSGGGTVNTKLDNFHIESSALCPITFCNLKFLSILPFSPKNVVFCTFICHES